MILTDPEKIRLQCEPVSLEEYPKFKRLLEGELAASKDGIGLALPQLGIAKRMAIVRIPTKTKMLSVDLVNCRIDKRYDEFTFEREGCLSFPGMYVSTRRFREIVVVDNLVEPYTFTALNLFSIAIQHEWDHIEGVLLPDRDIMKGKKK